MMGLEPTTFCMASGSSVRARSLKVRNCRPSSEPTEHERTRTNDERDQCDHGAELTPRHSGWARHRTAAMITAAVSKPLRVARLVEGSNPSLSAHSLQTRSSWGAAPWLP